MDLQTGRDGAPRGGADAYRRLAALFDDGAFTQLDAGMKSGEQETGVVTGFGYVGGNPAYAFSQDAAVDGGAMGTAQAAKIGKIYELAVKTGAPVVGFYDSIGARLAEGAGSLAAYGELILLSNRLSGVVPQISVIAGPCGGSSAVLAALADIVVMSEKGSLFLTPPSLLGGDAGSAADAAKNGAAHITAADDAAAAEVARRLIALLPVNNLSAAASLESAAPAASASGLAPGVSADALLDAVADAGSRIELSGVYAPEIRTLLAAVGGAGVGIVASDRAAGGRITGAGARKAARFVRFCDAFSLPVVTLADTDGFEPGEAAGQAALLRGAAALTHAYSEATTPKVALVYGSAVGPAFTALAGRASGADIVFAWPDAVISPLPPETAVSILWNERLAAGEGREVLTEEYKATLAGAREAAAGGHIDDIVEPGDTLAKISAALDMLSSKRVSIHPKKHSNIPL